MMFLFRNEFAKDVAHSIGVRCLNGDVDIRYQLAVGLNAQDIFKGWINVNKK